MKLKTSSRARSRRKAGTTVDPDRFRNLVEDINDWIWEVDASEVYTYSSPKVRDLLGYDPAEILGKTPCALMLPDEARRISEVFGNIRRGRKPFDGLEYVNRHKEGRLVVLETSGRPIFGPGGALLGYRGVARDITGRKKSEQVLARIVRAHKTVGRCNEAMVRIPDEARLLDEICRILVEEGGYRLAWVGLAENDLDKTVRPAAWAGRDDVDVAGLRLTWGQGDNGRGPTGTAIRTGRPVVVPDIPNDPVYSNWRPEAIRRRFASSMALPLGWESGHAIGSLNLYSDETREFDGEEIDLMVRLANDLAYGIWGIRAFEWQNRLNEDLTRSREALRDLARDIQAAREEERAMIAREIHDALGQELTVMKMEVAWLEKRLPEDPASLRQKARSVKDSIDAAIGTVQRISGELRPGVLDHLGIAAAVAWQAKKFGDRSGIPCAVSHPEREFDLEKDRATALFRIFQEALTNVARHSGADRVAVGLSEDRGAVVLTVEDNGKGISAESIADARSLGLIGMRERIRPFGGVVEIEGVDGSGTRLAVRIPFAGGEKRA